MLNFLFVYTVIRYFLKLFFIALETEIIALKTEIIALQKAERSLAP